MQKTIMQEAIANIVSASKSIEKFCSEGGCYSPYAAGMLEHMSWELHKHANELEEINYLYAL